MTQHTSGSESFDAEKEFHAAGGHHHGGHPGAGAKHGFWGWLPLAWGGMGQEEWTCEPRGRGGPFGPHGGGRWGWKFGHGHQHGHGHGHGHGPGGGRERMFDAGEIKLVILKLLSEQPSYGYQLIKTMEERLAGEYTPSAGVIYPTLTLLEEEGLATSAVSEQNRKVYTITPEGKEHLAANKERLDALFERLERTGDRLERGRSPELMQAFMNLRAAVIGRVGREGVTREQIRKIAQAINAAAKTIEEL